MLALFLAPALLSSPAGERPPAAPPAAEKPPAAPPVESPQEPTQAAYDGVYARVAAGERLVLAVGVPAPDGAIRLKTHPGIDPGVYDCFLLNGVPNFQRRDAVPGVTAPTTFHNPTHRCDACGYESPPGIGTWIIRSFNRDGSHTHQCPKCGHSWSH